MRSRIRVLWLLACLASAEILWGVGSANPSAAAVRALTASPTRVVWCQDAGNGSDSGAMGNNLRLMGFDTEDGRGERAILGQLSNYAKPLLAPCGERVIFSNRQEQKIYAVNWDGSGLRVLTAGFALAVWEDQRNSNVWIYAGTAVSNQTALQNVRRYLLDKPSVSEPVWDKTPVDVDNFQLSADGRYASGQYPWPDCGYLDLAAGVAHKVGTGCWPSLAPDNSYRLWIFDGAHRNLALFDPASSRRWVVNINHAPGIGGFEVYHPRWSSHPRFMAMTGPYTVGDRDNRIRGGGALVEIHIGRFSPDFNRIEQWVQVTRNKSGDFFPDVRIAGSPVLAVGPPVAVSAPQTTTNRQAIARLVLMARPVELSRIPSPAAIAPYRQALVANRYQVERVQEGQYAGKEVMAAHWAIRDGQTLPAAARATNETYCLVLEPFDEHPELEGQRLVMDSDEFSLKLYYEIRDQKSEVRSQDPGTH